MDQEFVKQLAKVKALLSELNTKNHDHDSQDTGISKRGICGACQCALKKK